MSERSESPVPAVVFILVGGCLCVGAQKYGVVVDGRMGPGLMPGVAGAALILLGGALLRLALGAPARSGAVVDRDSTVSAEEASDPGASAAGEDAEIGSPAKPWIIFGLVVMSLLAAPTLGLILSLGLMTVVLLRFVEGERWLLSLFATAACSAMSWLVFVELLRVPMPGGVFGLGG